MLKKFVGVMLLSVLFTLTTSVNVFAAETEEKDVERALEMIEDTNERIEWMIENAQKAGSLLQEDYLADMEAIEDESEAEARTAKYNQDLDILIGVLYHTTLQMSETTITAVGKLGVTAECEWVLVDIADREVWIDPVRVVGF